MKRKAFNFYRSYYDVALLLPEIDRAEFLMAICHAQFTGEIKEPEFPMAKLAFASQLHSIKKQIDGFVFGTLTPHSDKPLKEPSQGALQGASQEPLPQVQVQGKEKEKEKEKGLAAHAAHINFKKQSEVDFINEMRNFDQLYSKDMLNTFYQYWSEKDAKGAMRFQREKTWELDKRLMRWKSKQKEYGKAGAKSVNDFIENINSIKA
jgi:hypothetical protein